MRFVVVAAWLAALMQGAAAQITGCTDEQAGNYGGHVEDGGPDVDDGSCFYPHAGCTVAEALFTPGIADTGTYFGVGVQLSEFNFAPSFYEQLGFTSWANGLDRTPGYDFGKPIPGATMGGAAYHRVDDTCSSNTPTAGVQVRRAGPPPPPPPWPLRVLVCPHFKQRACYHAQRR
jgi:hypothetical protein